MRHWTTDAAYAAALALLAFGCAALALGHGWGAVAVLALAVALLVALRLVEHRQGVRDAYDVKAEVAALQAALKEQAATLENTTKTADTALRAAAASKPVAKPGY